MWETFPRRQEFDSVARLPLGDSLPGRRVVQFLHNLSHNRKGKDDFSITSHDHIGQILKRRIDAFVLISLLLGKCTELIIQWHGLTCNCTSRPGTNTSTGIGSTASQIMPCKCEEQEATFKGPDSCTLNQDATTIKSVASTPEAWHCNFLLSEKSRPKLNFFYI